MQPERRRTQYKEKRAVNAGVRTRDLENKLGAKVVNLLGPSPGA